MLAALLWPALWNGFPIIFYDTGGYLARPFEATLAMGRSALYGAFLELGIKHNFWPIIVAQAALVAWLVVLMLRVHGFSGKPWLASVIVIGLCTLTGLPWYAAQLMPDIMAAAFVLAIAMLAFHADGLQRWETITLIVVIAASIASHMSILALGLSIMALLAALHAFSIRIYLPQPTLAYPALAIVSGILLAPLSNFVITNQFVFTPGGFNFVFSRLVQDGIVRRYLADRCPDSTIQLCAYREEIPNTADDWLWAEESPKYKLGGSEQFESQARHIVIESLALYPAMHLRTALTAAINQFTDIATGDGLTPWNWDSQWTFERFAPAALERYLGSRQAHASIDFSWVNLIHIPVQAFAIAMLPVIILLGSDRRIAAFATLLFVALLSNAVVCGVLSSPHDRYQSRIAWLAPLIVVIAVLDWLRHHRMQFG
jgi:hypothetical protein